jgi:hypothetical protein
MVASYACDCPFELEELAVETAAEAGVWLTEEKEGELKVATGAGAGAGVYVGAEAEGLWEALRPRSPKRGLIVRNDDRPLVLKKVHALPSAEEIVSARSVALHVAQTRTPQATVFETDIVNLLFDDQ